MTTAIAAPLETHVFVDADPKKTVPCAVCGRPCVVHAYAATKWVKCLACKPRTREKIATGKRSTLMPDIDLPLGELRDRLQGKTIAQAVEMNGIRFEQELICGYIKDKRGNEAIGLRDVYTGADGGKVLRIMARDGGCRHVRWADIVSVR
jgi:hypothetical protein